MQLLLLLPTSTETALCSAARSALLPASTISTEPAFCCRNSFTQARARLNVFCHTHAPTMDHECIHLQWHTYAYTRMHAHTYTRTHAYMHVCIYGGLNCTLRFITMMICLYECSIFSRFPPPLPPPVYIYNKIISDAFDINWVEQWYWLWHDCKCFFHWSNWFNGFIFVETILVVLELLWREQVVVSLMQLDWKWWWVATCLYRTVYSVETVAYLIGTGDEISTVALFLICSGKYIGLST